MKIRDVHIQSLIIKMGNSLKLIYNIFMFIQRQTWNNVIN